MKYPNWESDVAATSDGTEQGIRAGQNIRTEHQKFLVVRTEHWSEHQNILNEILIKLFIF